MMKTFPQKLCTLFLILLFAQIFVLAFFFGIVTETMAPSFADDTKETAYLPVLMYHSILKSQTSAYILHPDLLDADLAALKKAGYETVTLGELTAYADGYGSLPKKPILITFDDGHYNNLYYAEGILEKHGFTAVVNVIGKFSQHSSVSGDADHPEYSHLTWDEIKAMNEKGVFEIGNHTYNMHNFKPRFGIQPVSGETEEDYKTALISDIDRLQSILTNQCNVNAVCFAYPFGKYNKLAKETLKELGFRVILTCSGGVNIIEKGNKDTLLSLKRIERESSLSTETLLAKVQKIPKA